MTAAGPSRHRVAIWREPRHLGALTLAPGVWAVPATPAFQPGIRRASSSARRADGRVLVLDAEPHDEATSTLLIAEFTAARQEEWAEFVADCDKYEAELAKEQRKGKLTLAELEEEHSLEWLRRWWRDLKARDALSLPRPPRPSSTSSAASSSWTPTPTTSTGPSTSRSARPAGPAMRDWLLGLGVALGLMVAGWTIMILAARRLPPGPLRELARFIPDCLTTIRRLRGDPRVPGRAKVAIVLAALWLASPIDLIPEFLPVIGPLDDVVVVALALRYAGRQVPRQMLLDAWPGDGRLLERLLGPPAPDP